MTPEEKLKLEEQIVEMIKTVYDPEIPVDIYNLGLIYNIDLADDGLLVVERSSRDPEPRWPDGFGPGARRDYGETALFLCRPAKR